jgi:hypothetical protein
LSVDLPEPVSVELLKPYWVKSPKPGCPEPLSVELPEPVSVELLEPDCPEPMSVELPELVPVELLELTSIVELPAELLELLGADGGGGGGGTSWTVTVKVAVAAFPAASIAEHVMAVAWPTCKAEPGGGVHETDGLGSAASEAVGRGKLTGAKVASAAVAFITTSAGTLVIWGGTVSSTVTVKLTAAAMLPAASTAVHVTVVLRSGKTAENSAPAALVTLPQVTFTSLAGDTSSTTNGVQRIGAPSKEVASAGASAATLRIGGVVSATGLRSSAAVGLPVALAVAFPLGGTGAVPVGWPFLTYKPTL